MPTENFIGTGQTQTVHGRLQGLIWSGATTAGDSCMITDLYTNKRIFAGRASGVNTFQGVTFAKPIVVRAGLQITQISAGELILYFEDV